MTGLPEASISEGIFGDKEAADNGREEAGSDQRQAFLDEVATGSPQITR